jgi:excisionase family DNA binding protein
MNRITLSISEFVAATGLGRTKTYELIKGGELHVIKVGRRTLITVESVHHLMAGAPINWLPASCGNEAADWPEHVWGPFSKLPRGAR